MVGLRSEFEDDAFENARRGFWQQRRTALPEETGSNVQISDRRKPLHTIIGLSIHQ